MNFFVEFFVRLGSTSPKFFKWIQLAAILVLALGGASAALHSAEIPLPTWMDWVDKTVAAMAGTALVIARLPKPNPPAPSEPAPAAPGDAPDQN